MNSMTPNTSAALIDRYEGLLSGRGFVELTDWTCIALTGADRQSFLHNFCTNDVKRLSSGENCEAFFTNVKGKIIGHGLITCRKNELVVIGEPGQATKLIEHLDRYILREDVQLQDNTGSRAHLLMCGAPSAFAGFFLPHLDYADATKAPSGDLRDFPAQLLDVAVYLTNWYAANERFFLLIETNTADLQKLEQKLVCGGLLACNDAFEMVRIEAGIPLFGFDFDDRNLPQEVGRDETAISFTKGCYLGQETVARIDALGHVNQQLVGMKFSGERIPDRGTELTHAGKTTGHVTSSAFSPKLQAPLALAMLHRERCGAGNRLDSPSGPCEVISLPL
jgi:folate-binding protein YgfZ